MSELLVKATRTMDEVASRRFYADTLVGDEPTYMLVTDAMIRRSVKTGNERLIVRRGLIEFPSVDAAVAAVVEGGWVLADEMDGDPQWRPNRDRVLYTPPAAGGTDE